MAKSLIEKLKRIASGSSLRKNIGMTLGRQLLAAFAQFLLVVLIARELGPEGNGFYAMAILIPAMLGNFLNLGVGPATVYYVSRKDFNVHQAIAGNIRLALAVAAIGVAFSLPVLLIWGEEVFPGVPQGLLYLGLVSFPLTLLLGYLNTILQGLEDFKAFNLTVLLPPYINLAGVIIALYLLPFGVAGAMVAYIVGQFAGLLIVLTLLVRKRSAWHVAASATSQRAYARKVLSYGWRAHLSNIVTFVNYRADIFLVNFFLTPVSTGIYVIAVQVAEKIWIPSQAASTVLLPRFSTMYDNPEARAALVLKAFMAVTAMTAVFSLGAAAALWLFISPVFGEEYVEALPPFLWLLPGIITWAGARVFSNCIAAAGKPEWNMYSAICVLIINMTGNVILIPKYGIVGAAWATSLAYCFDAVVKWRLIRLFSPPSCKG